MIKPQHVELLERIAKHHTEHPTGWQSLLLFVDSVDERVRVLRNNHLIKVHSGKEIGAYRMSVHDGVEITQLGRNRLLMLTGRDYGADDYTKAAFERYKAVQERFDATRS